MKNNFEHLISRIKSLPGADNVAGFARTIRMNQKTVDLYMKGERKPSLEFVQNICTSFGVSADWLLGLKPDSATVGNGGADAVSKAKLEGLKAAIRSLLEQY